MARYKAKMPLFVDGRRIKAGEVFVSDDKPGRHWEEMAEPKDVRIEPKTEPKPAKVDAAG